MDELVNSGSDRPANLTSAAGRRAQNDVLTQCIAIVPEASEVNASELARVGAALQKQVTRDLGPVWGVSATIAAFPRLEDVPVGYWPIIVTMRDLGSEAGVHMDKHGQPFALVELSPSWSLAASHECLQMLVSPYGNRTVTGPSPRADQWEVEFLIQVCDPCGDARYAYTVNDVLVSDFCTPMYYEAMSGGQGSFTRAIETPHEVLPGGYLCWYDPISDNWWMRSHFGEELTDMNLGPIDCKVGTMREVINTLAPGRRDSTKMSIEAFEARMGVARQRAMYASQYQAHRLRAAVAAVGNVALPAGHRLRGLSPVGEPALTTTLPGADLHARVARQQIEDAHADTVMPLQTPRGGFGSDSPRRGTWPAPGLQMPVDGAPTTQPMDTSTQRLASYPSYPSARPARRSSPPPPLPTPTPPPVQAAYGDAAVTAPSGSSPASAPASYSSSLPSRLPPPISSMAPTATPSSRPQPPMTRWASGRTLFAAGLLAVLFGGAGVVAYDSATSQRASATASQPMDPMQPMAASQPIAPSRAIGASGTAGGLPAAGAVPTAGATVATGSVTVVPPAALVAGQVEGVKPSTLPLAPPTTLPVQGPVAGAARAAAPVAQRPARPVGGSAPISVAPASVPATPAAPASSVMSRPVESRSDDPVDGLIEKRK